MAKNNQAQRAIDDDYVNVAQRITQFREQYPEGRLRPLDPKKPYTVETVDGDTFIVYVAAAYRSPDDKLPGVGSAWEPFPGPTPFTRNSELQNAETSAWGRAIVATLAADTKRSIASAEEVQNRAAEREQLTPTQRVFVALQDNQLTPPMFVHWLKTAHGVDRFAALSKSKQQEVADNLEYGDITVVNIRDTWADSGPADDRSHTVPSNGREGDAAPITPADPSTPGTDGTGQPLADVEPDAPITGEQKVALLEAGREAGWSTAKLLKRARALAQSEGAELPRDLGKLSQSVALLLYDDLMSELSPDAEPEKPAVEEADCSGTPHHSMHKGPLDNIDTRGGVQCRACGDQLAGPETPAEQEKDDAGATA